MMENAGMSKLFWDEAIRTAAYIMNRSSSSNLESVTEAEAWYNPIYLI